jgi:multimeric flavodoxin WrbA
MQCVKRKNKKCMIEGDFVNECLKAMESADAILLGSPTYFGDVTAEMKALIDRAGFVSLANDGLLSGKIGAAVVAVRRAGGTHVFDSINHMFQISSMIIPGSLYWNLGVALDRGDALKDDEGMRNNCGNFVEDRRGFTATERSWRPAQACEVPRRSLHIESSGLPSSSFVAVRTLQNSANPPLF